VQGDIVHHFKNPQTNELVQLQLKDKVSVMLGVLITKPILAMHQVLMNTYIWQHIIEDGQVMAYDTCN
jgi:hypothetical protein